MHSAARRGPPHDYVWTSASASPASPPGHATFPARHAKLAGTGFHLATVSAAGAMEPLLAVISFTTSRDSGQATATRRPCPSERR